MVRIDAHAHLAIDHPESIAFLRALECSVLNVCVPKSPDDPDESGRPLYRRLAHFYPNRLAWCTTFPPWGLDQPGVVDRLLEQLATDFADGAVACKLWKNVGMEVGLNDGRPLLPDDPLLDPIYRWLDREGHPLLMHVADPPSAWEPPGRDGQPPSAYLRQNPQWYLFGRHPRPSRVALLAARDRVLERYPSLTVIGAHLGSLENDLPQLALLLRRYPRFAVDLSARTVALLHQDHGLVRDFLLEFSDRVLWGSDAVQQVPHSLLSDEERRHQLDRYGYGYPASLAFYGQEGPVQYGPYPTEGLGLPPAVVRQIFRDNALTWYPRLSAWANAQPEEQS